MGKHQKPSAGGSLKWEGIVTAFLKHAFFDRAKSVAECVSGNWSKEDEKFRLFGQNNHEAQCLLLSTPVTVIHTNLVQPDNGCA